MQNIKSGKIQFIKIRLVKHSKPSWSQKQHCILLNKFDYLDNYNFIAFANTTKKTKKCFSNWLLRIFKTQNWGVVLQSTPVIFNVSDIASSGRFYSEKSDFV